MSTDRFDPQAVEALLTTRTFGRNLIALPQTGSTNDEAKELARQGAADGTVVVTDEQLAGRGRLGRSWLAPPGTCLLCSILFRPSLPPTQASWLTMLCSLAAADGVKEIGGLSVSLKWPNDLVVLTEPAGDASWRKLAGVLTETALVGEQVEFAIVGIGINVNVPAELLPGLSPEATSVLAETGHLTSREELLAKTLAGVEDRYERLRQGESPHSEWCSRLATLGRQVEVVTSQGVLTGLAEGVTEAGELLLRTTDGTLHQLAAGDVTIGRKSEVG
jgi:BirA family biotin operon repressor/biotin-[acetyl-CoA-carboxylase] ligase